MCLGEIVVGVDLPPGDMICPVVEYPSGLSECGEVKVPSKNDDVENDWNEEDVCWSVSVNRDQGWKTKRGLTDGKDELVVESCGYDLQEDSQTERWSPKGDIMLIAK